MRKILVAAAMLGAAGAFAQNRQAPGAGAAAAAVDEARLLAADSEPGQWLAYGRTYTEQRYSPLDQVTTRNVGELGLAGSPISL